MYLSFPVCLLFLYFFLILVNYENALAAEQLTLRIIRYIINEVKI